MPTPPRLLIDGQGRWKVPALNGDEPVTSRANWLTDASTPTIPAWMTTTGTTTLTGDKRLACTTAATVGATATATGVGLNSGAFKAIWLRLKTLSFSSQSVDVDFAIAGSSNAGAFIRQTTTDSTAKISVGGTFYPIQYQITKNGNSAGCRRDMGLLVIPKITAGGGYALDQNAEVWVTEGREIMAGLPLKPDGTPLGWIGGTITPQIKVTAQAASAQALVFAEWELSAWV